MKDNKKIFIIIGIVIIVIIAIIVIVNLGRKDEKSVKESETKIVDNNAKDNVEVEDIVFSDITKNYDSGITTIRAKMTNNTNSTKNVTLKITLKNDSGDVVKEMTQIVENLEPNRVKTLSTGISGDYTNINNIKFEVVK